jgi:Fe-S cluster assembly scaffold protein SufB
MKITWEDISSNIVYSKLTGEEPNPIFTEIYDFLQHWIPSIIIDTTVTVNNKYSYYYNSKSKCLWIDYKNICQVFVSKYGMEHPDTQTLVSGYAVSIHNIEVKHTRKFNQYNSTIAVSTHNIEVKHTEFRLI